MSQTRQPKGVPIGGQYAESQHDEAGGGLGDSNGEDNSLLSAYWDRVQTGGGDPVADARDMIDSIDDGAFNLHSPSELREARAALTEITLLGDDDIADTLQGTGSLTDLIPQKDEVSEFGKFQTLDQALLFDEAGPYWSGSNEAPGGAFAVVHSHGSHTVIREDSQGFLTFTDYDSAESADAEGERAERAYTDWEREGEEFITFETKSGKALSIRHRPGGYSIHTVDDDHLVEDFDSDSEEEMQVEEQARNALAIRGIR